MQLSRINCGIFLCFALSFFFFLLSFSISFADGTPTPTPTTSEQTANASDISKKIEELEEKVSGLKSQEKTLSSEIAVIDNQIELTQLKIEETQHQITELNADIQTATTKVKTLEGSLDTITKILINRIRATYEIGTIQPMQILLTSSTVFDYVTRANYLRIAQENDKKLLYSTAQAKNDYNNQKNIFEQEKAKVASLKKQLDVFNAQMDEQRNIKQNLLTSTKNDESKFQDMLAAARAEYEAIQGILAGNGSEVEKGSVTQGERIATIISGASCNSGGTHLHFIVSSNGTTQDPFGYLKSADITNCSGASCPSSDGDPANPSGSWDWPIDTPVYMYQGYGTTWAVRNTYIGQIYNFHNGIDIFSSNSSLDVHAVKDGELFQGSYSGTDGCRLRYVRVHHNEGGLDTFYLHINYIM